MIHEHSRWFLYFRISFNTASPLPLKHKLPTCQQLGRATQCSQFQICLLSIHSSLFKVCSKS